jgi:hypothetical protein
LEFERRGGKAARWLLAGWWAASLALTAPAAAEVLEYFRNPGRQFYSLILVVAPALLAILLGYAWTRPRALRRLEPWALVGIAVAGPLVWKPLAALTVLALACAALAAGRRLLEACRLKVESALERLVLSAGIGFGLLIPVLWGLGPATGGRVWTVAGLALGFHALGRCGRDVGLLLGEWSRNSALDHPLAGAATALAFPFLGIVLALALAPALAHDALMMHLPAAQHYAAADALTPLPHLSSTFYPQGGELIMAAASSVSGMAAAQLVQPLFFGLALCAVTRVAARCGASLAARYVGAVAAATLPFLAWTGGVAKNDLAMALFQALALLCVTAGEGAQRRAWLRLGVFFLAASFSVKSTAMFGAVPLGLLLLWRLRGEERKARELAVWAATFLLIAGAWPLRTYLLTGNPVYPAQLWWAVESLRPNTMRPAEWRSIPYWEIPWTIHFEGETAFESPAKNPMGFFLWLFAPLWLLFRRKGRGGAEALCLIFAWVYFFYWGSVWPVVRYAIVPIALLTALTAWRVMAAWDFSARAWRPAILALFCLNGVVSLLTAMIFSVNGPQLELFAGRIGEKEYLRRTLLTYPVLERLAQENHPGDWTLGVGIMTAAHAPDPARFDCERTFDPNVSGETVHRLLASGQYRFLITPRRRAGKAIVAGLDPSLEAVLLYRDRWFELRRLKTRGGAPP